MDTHTVQVILPTGEFALAEPLEDEGDAWQLVVWPDRSTYQRDPRGDWSELATFSEVHEDRDSALIELGSWIVDIGHWGQTTP